MNVDDLLDYEVQINAVGSSEKEERHQMKNFYFKKKVT